MLHHARALNGKDRHFFATAVVESKVVQNNKSSLTGVAFLAEYRD